MVEQLGVGERRENSARRTRIFIFAALGLAGLVTGFFIGRGEAKSLVDGTNIWSPALAIGLIGIYLICVGASSVLLSKTTDEVQTLNHYKAGAFAGTAFMLVYPVWFLLWKGGLTGEPIHWVVYLVFVFTSIAASLFYRFR